MATSNGAHPIHNLPSELLQETFIWCSRADQNDEGYNVVSANRAPLVLSYVCSTWRQLALHTPELWCRLHLYWKYRQGSPSDLGQLWLSRCNSLPIYLSIYDFDYGFGRSSGSAGTYFALEYAAQPRSLSLHHPQSSATQRESIRFDHIYFPKLRHLELRAHSGIALARYTNSIRYPQLSSFRLDRFLRDDLEKLFDGAQSLSGSITHIDIHQIHISEKRLGMIADMFPLLSNLSVTIESGLESEPEQQKIVFTGLRRLKLTLTERDDSSDDSEDEDPIAPSLALNTLFAPQLIGLEAKCDRDPTIQKAFTKTLYEFIQRSECSLQELSISGQESHNSLNGTRVLELANTIPTLRKLVYRGILGVHGYCSHELSIHHLHEPTGIHPLIRVKENQWEFLPLLEELHCHFNADDSPLVGNGAGDPALPEGIQVLDQRMRSSFNRLKRCQATLVTRRPSGVSKAVLDSVFLLKEFGLTYNIHNLAPPDEDVDMESYVD